MAPTPTDIAAAIATRHAELGETLRSTAGTDLLGPSLLPDWSRLTIVCHLRYGAQASRRVTDDLLAGRPSAFYPGGRNVRRPATLEPEPGETAEQAVESFVKSCAALDELWRDLGDTAWTTSMREPDDNSDLGQLTLAQLALLRLTEVEVHGTDLDLGLSDWSDTFVDAAIPMRIRWLTTRRSNHAPVDDTAEGSWELAATGGPVFRVSLVDGRVDIDQASAAAADTRLVGSRRELLGFLLGRVGLDGLTVSGDIGLARRFRDAFPPP